MVPFLTVGHIILCAIFNCPRRDTKFLVAILMSQLDKQFYPIGLTKEDIKSAIIGRLFWYRVTCVPCLWWLLVPSY